LIELIEADWPAPAGIHALQTTRVGGVSPMPYGELNLGSNTGDAPTVVAQNRRLLREQLALPREPAWLRQVHGRQVIDASALSANDPAPAADAAATSAAGVVCAVLSADCLPVLFCSDDGQWIAAAHAGWRGLAAGVLEATIARAPQPPSRLLAWFGAAISPLHFEVGPEVRAIFVEACADDAAAFVPGRDGRWQADLYQLARLRLARTGLQRVYGGGRCCYAEAQQFYSFRRACHQGQAETGRMATLIWRALPG